MKKKLAAFLAMMMALVTMSSAAMAEEEKPTITAHKANAITIDGDLSDWDLSSPAVLEDASQIIRDLSFWQGPNDLSAKVYAAYDEENLYLAFDVTEDTPYGAIEMLPLDGEDNLKVFISTDPTDDPNRTEYHTNVRFFTFCLEKGERGGQKLQAKAGRGLFWALLLFVGIPLPGTGAWTGTLAASLLDMGFKKSVIAVLGGVLLAGVIMGLASAGLFTALFSLF